LYPQRLTLAERLFRMRKDAGLKAVELAAALGWEGEAGRVKVSRIQNGHQVPGPEEVTAWASVTGHRNEAAELLDLLAGMQTIHSQWRRRLKEGDTGIQEERDRRTQGATLIRNAEIVVIPGLLQTTDYARSIIVQASALFGTRDVDTAVQARMQRQEVLYDSSKTFEFVITEAALRLFSCTREVMLGQLDRLLSLGTHNLTLGIIPFGAELPMVPYNGFLLEDNHLTVETLGGRDEEHAGEESALYHRVFDLLMEEALTGDDARRMIAAAAEGLRGK
jgi:transcriptional regulator with XRE-family HTH domain